MAIGILACRLDSFDAGLEPRLNRHQEARIAYLL